MRMSDVLLANAKQELPEEIPVIEVLGSNADPIATILLNKSSGLMDPVGFIKAFKEGRWQDVQAICEKVIRIRELAVMIKETARKS